MITKMYAVSGMKCEGCMKNIRTAIKQVPEVIEVQVHLSMPQAIISMREEVTVEKLQQKIGVTGSYRISEIEEAEAGKLADKPQKRLNQVLGFFHRKKECCK